MTAESSRARRAPGRPESRQVDVADRVARRGEEKIGYSTPREEEFLLNTRAAQGLADLRHELLNFLGNLGQYRSAAFLGEKNPILYSNATIGKLLEILASRLSNSEKLDKINSFKGGELLPLETLYQLVIYAMDKDYFVDPSVSAAIAQKIGEQLTNGGINYAPSLRCKLENGLTMVRCAHPASPVKDTMIDGTFITANWNPTDAGALTVPILAAVSEKPATGHRTLIVGTDDDFCDDGLSVRKPNTFSALAAYLIWDLGYKERSVTGVQIEKATPEGRKRFALMNQVMCGYYNDSDSYVNIADVLEENGKDASKLAQLLRKAKSELADIILKDDTGDPDFDFNENNQFADPSFDLEDLIEIVKDPKYSYTVRLQVSRLIYNKFALPELREIEDATFILTKWATPVDFKLTRLLPDIEYLLFANGGSPNLQLLRMFANCARVLKEGKSNPEYDSVNHVLNVLYEAFYGWRKTGKNNLLSVIPDRKATPQSVPGEVEPSSSDLLNQLLDTDFPAAVKLAAQQDIPVDTFMQLVKRHPFATNALILALSLSIIFGTDNPVKNMVMGTSSYSLTDTGRNSQDSILDRFVASIGSSYDKLNDLIKNYPTESYEFDDITRQAIEGKHVRVRPANAWFNERIAQVGELQRKGITVPPSGTFFGSPENRSLRFDTSPNGDYLIAIQAVEVTDPDDPSKIRIRYVATHQYEVNYNNSEMNLGDGIVAGDGMMARPELEGILKDLMYTEAYNPGSIPDEVIARVNEILTDMKPDDKITGGMVNLFSDGTIAAAPQIPAIPLISGLKQPTGTAGAWMFMVAKNAP